MKRDYSRKDFLKWIRASINTQATPDGNAVCLDDYSKDGMEIYYYPKAFSINGDEYRWTILRTHTKGRHLCNHYELWFFGKAFPGGEKIATGNLDKTKLRKGLRKIFEFYKNNVVTYVS